MRTSPMSRAGELARLLPATIISVALLVGSVVSVAGQSDPSSRPAIPSAGCGSSAVEPGERDGSMEVADLERTWRLAVPSVHDGRTPLPLVIALHGGDEFYSSRSLLALAEDEGFVAVAPRDAYQDWWMTWDPQLPGLYLSPDNPDIVLVEALIDELGEELCIDLARVYATGFSIGGAGTSVLGCVLDDRLAAIAPVGGVTGDPGGTCNAERPVPILAIHGVRDIDVIFDGGLADWFLDWTLKDGSRVRESAWGQWFTTVVADPVPDRVAATATRYGCGPEPSIEPLGQADHYVWACPEDAEVELVAHESGHVWPSRSDGRTTEQLIWAFFEQHSMPE